ncbi:MAG: fused MFS/spermidine synthase [Bryobacteraceae bacterium]
MPADLSGRRHPGRWMAGTAFWLIGFSAVNAQIVLMRELMVVFQGNELSLGLILAGWLVWTAAGSGLLGKLGAGATRPERLVATLEAAVAFAFPLSIAAVRGTRQVLQPVTGEMLGPGRMLLAGTVLLAPFCLLSGWLFAAASRLRMQLAREETAAASSRVYLLEAIGSAVGGLLASLALIRWLGPFAIAWAIAGMNLVVAARLGLRSSWAPLVAAALWGPGWIATQTLENVSLAALWRGFHVLDSRNSIYGNLTVVETEGSRTLYETGLAAGSAPDPAAAEEAIHYALLEHPRPRSLLLIGGGWQGSLLEALKHRTLERVDYVELDPAVLSLAGRYFRQQWLPARLDPRVHVHALDGRLYVRRARERFDVIIVNLPEPETAQLNRFYTLEFFREAAQKLNPDGVLALRLRGSENYVSPELARLLASIHATLRQVFTEVAVLPGETVHFFAARRAGVLVRDADGLEARWRERGIETRYVRDYYFRFRLTPARVRVLEQQMAASPGVRLNRDFAPVGYYYGVTRWSAQFDVRYRAALEAAGRVGFAPVSALVLFAGALLAWRASRGGTGGAAALAVAAMGFTLMALQVLLLIGFQALYGYVYHQLALIIGAFMAGMAVGSRRALLSGREGDGRRLAVTAVAAAVSGLALFAIMRALGAVSAGPGPWLIGHVVFPALAAACGGLGGFQFPVASRLYFQQGGARGAGALYALDLTGSCVGALLVSAYLLPVFGYLKTAWVIGLVNLPAAWLAVRRVASH